VFSSPRQSTQKKRIVDRFRARFTFKSPEGVFDWIKWRFSNQMSIKTVLNDLSTLVLEAVKSKASGRVLATIYTVRQELKRLRTCQIHKARKLKQGETYDFRNLESDLRTLKTHLTDVNDPKFLGALYGCILLDESPERGCALAQAAIRRLPGGSSDCAKFSLLLMKLKNRKKQGIREVRIKNEYINAALDRFLSPDTTNFPKTANVAREISKILPNPITTRGIRGTPNFVTTRVSRWPTAPR